ncbi:MAG TPA: hypothetical protein VN047_02750 [Sphingopyxis sp.]|uniref:hypothetical protein n=1 Tax=Sphingopyxis sp. TaxID=1908224 RepID=UPI002BB6F0C6|nr:hypothetical protein [Sphingopyxis sp.]HWW55790.1 hypothetical protein [Sphingopyxis sp.]
MGRIKRISDEDVLGALLGAMEATGPAGLTFAKAAAVVGLSSATLVQRFGTRDAMIEAVLLHAWDRLDALTAAADSEAPETPAGAIALLLRLMPGDTAERDVTEGLLLLREDLRNPALRARGHAWGDYLAKSLSRRLPCRSGQAGQTGWQMLSIWQGAIIWWAFKRDGDPEAAIRSALEGWWASVGSGTPADARD